MKRCAHCKIVKPFSEFNKNKTRKDGYQHSCKQCRHEIYLKYHGENKARHHQYYQDHKDEVRARNIEWKKNNPERVKHLRKAHYHNHREEMIEYSVNWINENREKFREYMRISHSRHLPEHAESQRRRYAKKIANGCEKIDYREIYERDNYTCQMCGKKNLEGFDLTIDHIIPIAKGGPHIEENLQVACRSCNCSKGANI